MFIFGIDDENRVVLEQIPEDPLSDYINASFIPVSVYFNIKLCLSLRLQIFSIIQNIIFLEIL